MKKVDRPRKKPFTGSFYTKEEALQLMELFKGDPMYALIVTAVYYGMRRSELLGLTWDSVDFESNTISVAHKVYRDNAGGDARGQRLNTLYRENIDEAAILDTLDGLFARYAGEREGGEGFGDFLHRSGVVALPSYPTHRQIAPDLYA